MSQIFFDELGIPQPDINLGVGSGSHGRQTGEMLMRLEEVIQEQNPDWVLVYGDTNSTLAGALAAVKLHVPVAHVEAGLRSFNRAMPEEHNRVLTDHCSDLLLCPTQTSVDNLVREGIDRDVYLVGDTMYDAVLQFTEIAQRSSTILRDLELDPQKYLLSTVHRPYNTDNVENLRNILLALGDSGETVVIPTHPRTRARLEQLDWFGATRTLDNLKFLDPVGYLDMLVLEKNARMILTDSGGVQKEAYFFGVPCVTLRPETEWVETVEAGWNKIADTNRDLILDAIRSAPPSQQAHPLYGDGKAAQWISYYLEANLAR
jgi:UDP-N-acetylglucosamine 2-epimerase